MTCFKIVFEAGLNVERGPPFQQPPTTIHARQKANLSANCMERDPPI